MSISKLSTRLSTLGCVVLFAVSSWGTPGSGVSPSYKVVSSNANIAARAIAGKLLLLEFDTSRHPVNIPTYTRPLCPEGTAGGILMLDLEL